MCRELNCVHVLLDETLEGPRLRLTEVFRIVSDPVDEVRRTIRAPAFVDTPPERRETNQKLGETVSVNRGLTVKAFDKLPEAEGWLVGKIGKAKKRPT